MPDTLAGHGWGLQRFVTADNRVPTTQLYSKSTARQTGAVNLAREVSYDFSEANVFEPCRQG